MVELNFSVFRLESKHGVLPTSTTVITLLLLIVSFLPL